MKVSKKTVSSTTYSSAPSVYGKAKKVQEVTPVQDSVEVSNTGSVFQSAMEVAANTPDIRTEAIEGIQQELSDGTYHRDESEVADKVLQDYLAPSI